MSSTLKRTLLLGVALAMLATAIVWSYRPQPITVDLAVAATGPLRVTVTEEGRTRVRNVYVVSAPVMGRVRRIGLEVGDSVSAGITTIAEIEPSAPAFLDERARAEAQADVAAAEDSLVLATAQVDQSKAEVEFAAAELSRARSLALSGTISEQSSDDALRAYRTHRAALATAIAKVKVAEHALTRARSHLATPTTLPPRGATCECIVLKAPISGRVLELHHESEGIVAPAEALVSLGDARDLEIVAELLSTDAVKVQPGMRVTVDGWGGEGLLEGVVERVEPFGFTKVSALGIEEQRVNMRVELTGNQERWATLGHGYRVDVSVVIWESPSVLTVPLTALFRSDQRWAVFVNNDGVARTRAVEVGRRAGLAVQITAGLKAGEQVVLSPSDRVRDGALIADRELGAQ